MSSNPLPDIITTPNDKHIPRHKVVKLSQFLSTEAVVTESAAKLIAKRDADITAEINIAVLEYLQIFGDTTLVVICTGNIGKTQEITPWVENNVSIPWIIHQDKNAESGAGNWPYRQGIWKGASGRIADSASRFDWTLLKQHKIGTVLFVAIEYGIDEFPLNGIKDDNNTLPQEGPVTYAVGVCYNAKNKSFAVSNSGGVILDQELLNQELLNQARNGGFEDLMEMERGIVTYGEAGEE